MLLRDKVQMQRGKVLHRDHLRRIWREGIDHFEVAFAIVAHLGVHLLALIVGIKFPQRFGILVSTIDAHEASGFPVRAAASAPQMAKLIVALQFAQRRDRTTNETVYPLPIDPTRIPPARISPIANHRLT